MKNEKKDHSPERDLLDLRQENEFLKKLLNKYQVLIHNIPDVIWTTDINGNTTFITPNIQDLYGYTPDEIYQQKDKLWFGRIHPDDVDAVKIAFHDLFGKGKPLDVDYRIQRKDGEWIWLQDKSIGTYEKDRVMLADGVLIDITDRKKSENEVLKIAEGVSSVVGDKFFISLVEHLTSMLGADYAYVAEFMPDKPGHMKTISFFSDGKIIENIETDITGTACEKVVQNGQCSYPTDVQKLFPHASIMAEMKVEAYFGNRLTDSSGKWIGILSVMFKSPVRETKRVESTLQIFASRATSELERKNSENKLKDSEEKFKSLYSSMEEGVALHEVIYDDSGQYTDYRIIDINPSFERITGLIRKQSIGKRASELYGTGEAPYMDIYGKVADSGEPFVFETYFPPMEKHFKISVVSLSRARFATVFMDITASIESRKKLMESEELFRDLFDNAGDLIQILAPDGSFLYVNDAWKRTIGYNDDELVKLNRDDIIHPDSMNKYMDAIQHVLVGESYDCFDTKFVTKEGKTVLLEGNVNCNFKNGKPDTIRAIFHDVTERRHSMALLKASEEKFRMIFENSPLGIIHFDETGRVTDCNNIIPNIIGVPKEKIKEFNMISSVEDKRMRSAVTRCLSSGKGHFEGDYVTVLGNRSLSLKAYFSSISMADKGTIGGIGIFEDITERKKSEVLISEIMKQEESVSVLGQNALEGIDLDPLLNDAVRIVTNILNVEYCKVLKLLPDKKNMILKAGKGWKKGLVGKATVRGDDNSQAGYTLTTGGPVIVDDLRKDTRFTGPPLLIDHGIVSGISVVIGSIDNPYGVLGAHTSRKRTFKKNDVHFLMSISNVLASAIRRKQNESLLYQSKRDWEETFNAITDMVTVQDRNFNIIYSNKAADKILRLPDLEVTKKVKCFEYYHGTNFPPKACPSCDSYKTGKPSTFSVFEPHLNMYLEIRAMPRLDENYNLTGLIHVVRDITQQRKLEAQLIHAQKMEAIGQLAGGVAHDFNNILTAVIGYSNLLQMKLDKDDVLQHNVKQIISITERGANLTQSLLAFSRKEAIDLKPVSLNKIVETSINVLPKLIGESIEIKKEFLDKRLFIMADSIQIERMIMNFASNARDAMPEGGTISFKTEKVNMDLEYIKAHGFGRQGMYALLSITDTGTGMNEEIKSRIFEPFFTTKKMGEGTGLGLSIVYGIVKQLNGFIIVYSEEGKGTTFSTYFPIIKEGTEDDTEDNIEHPRGDETVLLAEDEDEVRKPLKAILEKFGYNVIEATDGKEAVDKFNKNSDMVKLLIFDMIMPNKNGKTAYADIKLKKPDIKIIFISGYTADAPHIKEMLHEGLPFIAKPVLPRNLLRTMREVLDK